MLLAIATSDQDAAAQNGLLRRLVEALREYDRTGGPGGRAMSSRTVALIAELKALGQWDVAEIVSFQEVV